MECPKKSSLTRKRDLYQRAYSKAVLDLSAVALIRAEWDLAWALATRSKALYEDARAQLAEHVSEHCC
jgi:hypothetical protein